MSDPTRPAYFFAGRLSQSEISAIHFGDEGQGWEMMPIPRFLTHPRAVPELQRRTGIAWADLAPS
jgi:8-oxo-dGTP diphosphatase